MSNNVHATAPKSLVEQVGIFAGETDWVGKKIRITSTPRVDPVLAAIFGAPFYVGAEGTIVLVDDEGDVWADFGDDEKCMAQGPEDARVHSFTRINDASAYGDVAYEVIDDEKIIAAPSADSVQVAGPSTLQ